MRGIRTRLALALVALVAVTVLAIGLGTYAFVDARLREGLIADAGRQAQFNLSVLVSDRLAPGADVAAFEASGLPEAFRLRGDVETVVDFPTGEDYAPLSLANALSVFPASLTDAVHAGRLGYAWLDLAGRPSLVVGGHAAAGPDFYFVVNAEPIDRALEQLRLGLAGAAIIAILLALAAAGLIARGILRPVQSGSAAAARIAGGDLSARVAAGGADEFGRFGAEFNRMADTLESTIGRLREAQQQNRRFVADVSHELRTPMTALVAEASIIEASIIEAGLNGLPPDARRAAELLVADVRRLRALVDDLMELSRFDADAEEATLEPLELATVVRSIVANRLPSATLALPAQPIVVRAETRRLDRILGNLLDNARVHAPDGPVEVSIVGPYAEGMASVVVADRGPGVAPAALGHLFERFYKADPSRRTGSSGLGLAIAAEHAALLGGSLVAANRAGGGLELTLRLPVTGSLPDGDPLDTPGTDGDPRRDAAPAPPTRPER